ncbi:magmas-like protein [Panicum miliaceum]|uniref:Magmas-like protein n=1 Tax=Panicum miliaceum TaxID=4540 RepID=A0A3L6STE4_PANMI|nr:magmas-like protein [Panicum miliaceum]
MPVEWRSPWDTNTIWNVDANKTGAAQEAINGIRRASKAMTEQEAWLILGISEKSTWEEIVQKYDTMFERNAKNRSFYLQSKTSRPLLG